MINNFLRIESHYLITRIFTHQLWSVIKLSLLIFSEKFFDKGNIVFITRFKVSLRNLSFVLAFSVIKIIVS